MSLSKNKQLAEQFIDSNPGFITFLALIHQRQRREKKQQMRLKIANSMKFAIEDIIRESAGIKRGLS